MRLLIENKTGKPLDTTVTDLDTGQSIPVTRIEIEPLTKDNLWCPAVSIPVPRAYLDFVTDKVTIHVEEDTQVAEGV